MIPIAPIKALDKIRYRPKPRVLGREKSESSSQQPTDCQEVKSFVQQSEKSEIDLQKIVDLLV